MINAICILVYSHSRYTIVNCSGKIYSLYTNINACLPTNLFNKRILTRILLIITSSCTKCVEVTLGSLKHLAASDLLLLPVVRCD